MKIVITTAIGKSKSGEYYCLFPSRWSTRNRFHCTTYYPYELAYLSSLLKNHTKHDIKMIDGNYFGYTINKYAEILIDEKPGIIVLETDSLTYLEDIEMLQIVKNNIPVKIILCGPHPSTYPRKTLKDSADYVAIGEFETSILELIKSNFDPDTKGIYPNPRRDLLNLDLLPLPENYDIKRRDYCRIYGCEYREVEVFATRGCPFNCNFCAARNVYYAKPNFRIRNIKNVVDEIIYLQSNITELEGIFFNEESHTINRKYTKMICNALIEAGLNNLKYECMTNYSTLDRELLEKMKEAGYYKIRVGIETLDIENSEQMFKDSKAKKDKKKLFEILQLCYEIGLKVYVTLSVGTYGSTFESDSNTLNSIKILHESGLIQEFQVSINTPLPGTPFYNSAKEMGLIVTDDLNQYNGIRSCVISYPHYPKKEIEDNFKLFLDYGSKVINENRTAGINYSMYDTDWVKKVLSVTPISEKYR